MKDPSFFFVWVVLVCAISALGATPDGVMRAAGWDVDHATSETQPWEIMRSIKHPVYEIIYEFPGQKIMFLRVDPATSETVDISGEPGRGPNPTSDTITLTPAWAHAKLMSLNPYKIARGLIRMGDPVVSYDPRTAKYDASFPRLDAAGHKFKWYAAGFSFDHATSKVTGLSVGVFLPEPVVTTGTMISQEQATSIALQWLLAHKSNMFKLVPDKMTFDHVPTSVTVRVVERNVAFQELGKTTTGTAVAYTPIAFRSRLTDPSYTGRYELMEVTAEVDVFSGGLVAGYMSKMLAGGK